MQSQYELAITKWAKGDAASQKTAMDILSELLSLGGNGTLVAFFDMVKIRRKKWTECLSRQSQSRYNVALERWAKGNLDSQLGALDDLSNIMSLGQEYIPESLWSTLELKQKEWTEILSSESQSQYNIALTEWAKGDLNSQKGALDILSKLLSLNENLVPVELLRNAKRKERQWTEGISRRKALDKKTRDPLNT